MTKKTPGPVYSGHVVEFVAVATEFCRYAEHTGELKGDEILRIMQRLLPLLYLKAAFLPQLEPVFEDGNERFVTEADWYRIHNSFRNKLARANDYFELAESPGTIDDSMKASTLAEDFADIYQDLKNFVLLYQTGTEEVMNDAVWECRMNFENYWGKRLVNALGAIHRFIASGSDPGELADDVGDRAQVDHSDWFISRRQKEFREGDE